MAARVIDDMRIDPEFEQRIPPITQEEFNMLEENILTDGEVLNAIIVWDGIIVDGHNRYRILQKHPEISYHVYNKQFNDRHEALAWICRNQLGRRNLTLEQRKYLIGKQYESEKASHGRIRGNVEVLTSQSGKSKKDIKPWTCERIAKEHNTSKNTVIRAEAFAKGVDAADEVLPGIRREILSGTIRATEKEVRAIAEAEPQEREELVEQLHLSRNGQRNRTMQVLSSTANDEQVQQTWSRESQEEQEQQKPAPSVTRKMIQEISEGMLHSEGIAGSTESSMVYEMNDAFEDMVFRWNLCRETYPVHVKSKSGKAKIKELADQGMEYFRQVKKGALWSGQQPDI